MRDIRDIRRIKRVCNKIYYIWLTYCPDWKFCQLLMNFLNWYGRDPFYVEDDKFEELLDKYVESIFKNKE